MGVWQVMFKYIKREFYSDDDLTVTLEEADGNLMAHVVLYSASKASINRVLQVWQEIKERAYWQGYEEIYTYSNEPRMFDIVKGGEQVGEFEKDGIKYKVWKWELK